MNGFRFLIILGLCVTGAAAQAGDGQTQHTLFPPGCDGVLYWKEGQALKCAKSDLPACLAGQGMQFNAETGKFVCTGVAVPPSDGGGSDLPDLACADGKYLAGFSGGKAICKTLPDVSSGGTKGRYVSLGKGSSVSSSVASSVASALYAQRIWNRGWTGAVYAAPEKGAVCRLSIDTLISYGAVRPFNFLDKNMKILATITPVALRQNTSDDRLTHVMTGNIDYAIPVGTAYAAFTGDEKHPGCTYLFYE